MLRHPDVELGIASIQGVQDLAWAHTKQLHLLEMLMHLRHWSCLDTFVEGFICTLCLQTFGKLLGRSQALTLALCVSTTPLILWQSNKTGSHRAAYLHWSLRISTDWYLFFPFSQVLAKAGSSLTEVSSKGFCAFIAFLSTSILPQHMSVHCLWSNCPGLQRNLDQLCLVYLNSSGPLDMPLSRSWVRLSYDQIASCRFAEKDSLHEADWLKRIAYM